MVGYGDSIMFFVCSAHSFFSNAVAALHPSTPALFSLQVSYNTYSTLLSNFVTQFVSIGYHCMYNVACSTDDATVLTVDYSRLLV